MRYDSCRHLYHIIDTTGRIRYVGVTTRGEARLREHINEAFRWKYALRPFCRWLLNECLSGRTPSIKIVRKTGKDAESEEQREIQKLLRRGEPLTNILVHGQSRSGWVCDVCNNELRAWNECPTCDPRLWELVEAKKYTSCDFIRRKSWRDECQ